MNSKITLLFLSGLTSLMLSLSGLYLIANNLIQPQGYLFEGIVLLSLGLISGLMVTIALSIGQTILIFGQIMEQQALIQKEMKEISDKTSGIGINSFLKTILTPGANISIDSGDMTKDIPDIIKKLIRNTDKKTIEDMDIKELEDELAKAVKSDRFEEAEKIKDEILKRKNKKD
jgi:hypothetical protein